MINVFEPIYYLGWVIQPISYNKFWVYPRWDTKGPLGREIYGLENAYKWINKVEGVGRE